MVTALPSNLFYTRESLPTIKSNQFYVYFPFLASLVLLGGIFAGLTLGLMGQDEMYLKVISNSGTNEERNHAERVLKLMGHGKHWVLVTLLLSNVITNETLPIVLDRCFDGGWKAVVISSALVVVFGEIIPQAVCVRYGLQVGALFSPLVLALMYIMYPVAYPIALLLDYILGEHHGTVYKKSGLKSLVNLHHTVGVERLTQDEVTIISAVLDLKEKQVLEIMTPIETVFTISADKVLDEKAVEELFNSGFSRIPVHLPGQPTNFIGMLLVRVLISYDPEDALPVLNFPLATLPETSPKTSCLNILNYFQEGKAHMCVVSKDPGVSSEVLGVVTLEDVIEELIGEEIVDESDVFVNIHQRIIREQPGPLHKQNIASCLHSIYTSFNRASTTSNFKKLPYTQTNNFPQPDLQNLRSIVPFNPDSNPLKTKKSNIIIKLQAPLLKNFNRFLNTNSQYISIYDEVSSIIPSESLKNEYGSIFHAPSRLSINSREQCSAQNTNPVEHNSSVSPNNRASPESEKPYLYAQVVFPPESLRCNSLQQLSSCKDTWATKNRISSTYFSTKNGIVESVITVEGISKTIIEPAVDWDESHSLHNVNSTHSENKKKGKNRSKKTNTSLYPYE